MNTVTKQQMIELDERMIHQYKIPLERMMEHAGRGLAYLIQDNYPKLKRALVLVGSGNNGGGGLVAARFLAGLGYDVRVILATDEYFLKDVPKKQFAKLPMSIMIGVSHDAHDSDLARLIKQSDIVVDALLGYSVTGAPSGEIKRLIKFTNKYSKNVVSLDLPSGLDPDEGPIEMPVMRANTTLTIALPKEGLLYEDAQEFIGDLYAVDINVPDVWYKEQDFGRPAYNDRGYVHVPLVADEA